MTRPTPTTLPAATGDIPLDLLRDAERMSVRAYNACNNNGLHSLSDIRRYYEAHGTFTRLRNVGRLTESELVGIVSRYEQEGNGAEDDGERIEVEGLDWESVDMITGRERSEGHLRERLLFDRFVEHCAERFGIGRQELLPFRQDYIVRRFPLFRFLDFLFTRGKGLPERDVTIIRRRLNYHLGRRPETLETIAADLGLTRERVRQLAVAIPSRLRRLAASLRDLRDVVSYEPLYEGGRDLIIVDDDFADYVNAREGVSFTAMFYATVFEGFLIATHERVEEDFDEATDYLIRRDLTESFDFDEYLRDLDARRRARIPEDYSLSLTDQIPLFQRGGAPESDQQILSRIAAVCELLAREEFGIRADGEGDLLFERNTRRLLHEHIVELLEARGEPMHVEEISAALNEMLPELSTTAESVRAVVLRYERFARYEASSTYGLREWEGRYSHLKSGTFADIAEQFLEESATPRHLHEVADYVMQFRQTNRSSVIGTLKADTTGRFRHFEGGMIGLASLSYDEENLAFRTLSPRTLSTLEGLIRDNGGSVAEGRLIDYCVLHYRMPPAQARSLFDRACSEGRLLRDETGLIRLAPTPVHDSAGHPEG